MWPQVVLAINEKESGLAVSSEVLVSVLKKRLRSDNPHKQYLAVQLTKHILAKCATRVKSQNILQDILAEVAAVAAYPSKPDTAEAKGARIAAYDVLRGHGKAGEAAFKAVTGMDYSQHWNMGMQASAGPTSTQSGGEGQSSTSPRDTQSESPAQDGNTSPAREELMSPGRRRSSIQKLKHATEMSKSHTEVFQDMLRNAEPGQLEEGLLEELLAKLEYLKKEMPALIQKVSSRDKPESEALLGPALEALDRVNIAISLYKELKGCHGKEGQEAEEDSSVGQVPQGASVVGMDHSIPRDVGAPVAHQGAHQGAHQSTSGVPASLVPANVTATIVAPTNTTPANASLATAMTSTDPFGLGQLEDGLSDALASLAVRPSQDVSIPTQPILACSPDANFNPFADLPSFGAPPSPDPYAQTATATVQQRQLGRQVSAPVARTPDPCHSFAAMPQAGPQLGMLQMTGAGQQIGTMQMAGINQSNARSMPRSITQGRALSQPLSDLDPFAELAATPPRAAAHGSPMMGAGQTLSLSTGVGISRVGVAPFPGGQPLAMGLAQGPSLGVAMGETGHVLATVEGFRRQPQQSPT
ncbi:unnamed protein product [Ostreobium quekettii]|uniref:VHS domain-containing protein n=1 Tax=Ostreobium quekettii TaxID=121088 RepID=A0A8S1J8Q0_9CHLO|nr:unnamed protein product [Ostreobium quekettii]